MGPIPSHPVLSLDDAKRFEAELFGGDETKEWPAMQRAGTAVARAVQRDYAELAPFPAAARLLVLVGKGHNGGDALLAAQTLLARHPEATADVWFLFGERALRPLAARAWRELVQSAPGRVRNIVRLESSDAAADVTMQPAKRPPGGELGPGWSALTPTRLGLAAHEPAHWGQCAPPRYAHDIALDGVFGFQFRPPLAPELAALFARLNAHPVRFRAAVDLPSGLGDPAALRADFTYATGIVKSPALDDAHRAAVGRLRYLDLEFFKVGRDRWARRSDAVGRTVPGEPRPLSERLGGTPRPTQDFAPAKDRVLEAAELLAPLRALRPAACDKRTFGHLFILGGSRSYPGAVLLSALAAARSGAGLVTAFVPESLAAAFAARLPEVIWVGWPETPAGGLALEGSHLLRERLDRATALLLGPGIAREAETLALMQDIVQTSAVPLVIDADALQPDIVRAGSAPRVLTPHMGEFARIAAVAGVADPGPKTVTVLKGPLTRISDGGGVVYHSCFGGPVLARGGSGDVLAGLLGSLLAQTPTEPLAAACRGAVWHGLAADRLARSEGQVAVQTGQLVEHLAAVLREAE